MDNEYICELWKKLVLKCESKSVEIKTIRLNSTKGLWFKINIINDNVIVTNSEINKPSVKLVNQRIISKSNIIKLFPYYQKWKKGEIYRETIRNISINTSYVFGLLNYIEKNC